MRQGRQLGRELCQGQAEKESDPSGNEQQQRRLSAWVLTSPRMVPTESDGQSPLGIEEILHT